ncbi:hypothetical protein GWI33_005734 [Rhynchophorus ferrugineus]|uniref:Uncharacterized protein n=1 Tax=Rhynchophorus ferrugineus TaxID=354439 RepID=A0A834MHT1_RHYFE|nr:hypothetical protein GWI33_005734 [Rhynchophorus ferrugineus]
MLFQCQVSALINNYNRPPNQIQSCKLFRPFHKRSTQIRSASRLLAENQSRNISLWKNSRSDSSFAFLRKRIYHADSPPTPQPETALNYVAATKKPQQNVTNV